LNVETTWKLIHFCVFDQNTRYASTCSMPSFVRIRMAGLGSFAKLECLPADDIIDLTDRACAKFSHWGAASGTLSLYLVAEGDMEEPSDDAISAVLSRGCRLGADRLLKSVSPGAWLVAIPATPLRLTPAPVTPALATTAVLSKRFTLVKTELTLAGESVPKRYQVSISNDKQLRALVSSGGGGYLVLLEHASLDSCSVIVNTVDEIVTGETYTLSGGETGAFNCHRIWTQQAGKMLEEVSTLAVRDSCEKLMGSLEMSTNITLISKGGVEKEFDGLLVSRACALAIAVEAKHVAVEAHVDTVLRGAAFLREFVLDCSDERFKGVTDVLPVLAATRFSEAMIALCEKQGIGVVRPNGSGHTFTPPPHMRTQLSQGTLHALPGRRSLHTLPGLPVRSMHTLARVLRAIF
jgi:hypothetical protein